MKTYKKMIIAVSILIILGLVGTAIAAWVEYTLITEPDITSLNDGDAVIAGQEYTLECETSTDTDRWYVYCVESYFVDDNVTHTWSGPGTFDPNTGTSVSWTAPEATGPVTITVTVDDTGSPDYYDSPSKSDSVRLTVLEVNSVEVHTTSEYNDNGGSGLTDCQVHFGSYYQADYWNLFIEVSMYGGNSSDVNHFTLPVTIIVNPYFCEIINLN